MILVAGGAGYIGSHVCVELLQAGEEVVIIDNFSNSKRDALKRLEMIVQRPIALVDADIRDRVVLRDIFQRYAIDAVIHLAGYKAVGESVKKPLLYYHNNLDCTLSLCEAMQEAGCHNLIFSSSATVYAQGSPMPLKEDAPTGCTNPYGWTKYMSEQILRDLGVDNTWSIILLRYFNPIGAHASGLIGEDPNGIPNNLMPYISKVAAGILPELHVYGNDYDTPDGTGVRDYIHVVDLAVGHVDALRYARRNKGVEAINLGTGKGYSVLEVVEAFQAASGQNVPYVIDARRPGDVATVYASAQKAKTLLDWEAKRGIHEMCEDAWRFASKMYQKA